MAPVSLNSFLITIVLLAQFFLAILFRIIGGSWFSPGSFFALYWFVFMLYPLVLSPEYPVRASGVIWIFISSFALAMGSFFGRCLLVSRLRKNIHPYESAEKVLDLPGLNSILLGSILLGLSAPLYLLYSHGYLNRALFSMDHLLYISNRFSVMRYTEGFVPPAFTRLMVVFVYAAPLFGGLRWITTTRFRERLLVFCSFVPAMGMTVLLTTKTSFIFTFILFFSSIIGGSVFVRQGQVEVRSFVKSVLVSSISLLLLIFIADNLRVGRADKGVVEVWHHLQSAFAGHLAVFSYWFDNYFGSELHFGQFTFAGLFNLLGISQRHIGLYAKSTPLPMLNSNIYTAFRGIILDFSIYGSVVFFVILGITSEVSYILIELKNSLFISFIILFYTFTMWSFVVSIVNYNTVILSILILLTYFILQKKYHNEDCHYNY